MSAVIIGLGKTGLSCARFLARQGIDFSVVDSRAQPPLLDTFRQEFPEHSIYLGDIPLQQCLRATHLIVSPGVPLNQPIIQACLAQGIEVIGDIELFARHCDIPVIAITGANGKSTVTELVGAMAHHLGLSTCVVGNVGFPVLDALNEKDCELFVLELSSFQLESTFSLKPKVATILNITPDHMDRYESLDAYIAAKQRIYRNAQYRVSYREDRHTYPIQGDAITFFTKQAPLEGEFGLTQQDNIFYLSYGEKCLVSCNELKIKGQHNWLNALAALAIAHQMQWPLAECLSVIKEFPGLPHRCQWVREYNGAAWYNDSKATNIGASIASIEGLVGQTEGKLFLIAGGQGKGADFTELQDAVEQYVDEVIVFGEDAALIAAALIQHSKVAFANDLKQAVQIAAERCQKGDTILFAPACASFDMFKNFEHRGECFTKLVTALI